MSGEIAGKNLGSHGRDIDRKLDDAVFLGLVESNGEENTRVSDDTHHDNCTTLQSR
jgi:hypothetical protein